jgi:quinol monooxygenase YgiN
MSKISVVAKVKSVSGKSSETVAALQFAIDNAMKESGTRYYILNVDQKDPDVFWFYEMYDSQADLDAHMGAPWFAELGAKLGPLLAEAPELHFLRPISGKGL